MKFYIIRHGETDWNNLGKIQGRIDNPLNETGINQALETSKFFNEINPTRLITTPLVRAQKTLEIMKSKQYWNNDITIMEEFTERSFGVLEGIDGADFYKVTDFTAVEGYELDSDLMLRLISGLDKIKSQANTDDIVIITCHAHAIRGILIKLFPNKYNWENFRLKNCAIIELDYDQEKSYNLIAIH